MKKIIILLIIIAALGITSHQTFAMGSRPTPPATGGESSSGGGVGEEMVNAANSLGNNDAAQQAAGDIGAGIAKGGQALVNQAYEFGNQGVPQDKVNQMANTGAKVFGYGKAIEIAGKGASHVGWVATSAGRAAEGDYSGAAIEGVNGAGRSVATGAAGTAAGVWVAGKVGAAVGSVGGPLGTAAGFIIGCGAAWLTGKIWDKTIGAGADALDQKVHDWEAEGQYAGPKHGVNRDDDPNESRTGADVAGQTVRLTNQQTIRNNINRTVARPPSGGGGCGGCGGPCRR